MNKIAFTPGQAISGYTIKKVSPLPEINAHLIELVHEKTKAVHIHIANEDKENTFGVFFRTVPTDSTGVAHILEHTVLCGSEKIQGPGSFLFHAQTKPQYIHERIYRIGLDHVSVFHPEYKRLFQSDECLS